MNWTVAICLTIAALCIPAFVLIVRAIVREIRGPVVVLSEPSDDQSEIPPALPEVDDRTATLMFRQSFVATMMERFQEMGSPGDVLEYINTELSDRGANWRVRETPEGNGEFYELERAKTRRLFLRGRSAV